MSIRYLCKLDPDGKVIRTFWHVQLVNGKATEQELFTYTATARWIDFEDIKPGMMIAVTERDDRRPAIEFIFLTSSEPERQSGKEVVVGAFTEIPLAVVMGAGRFDAMFT